MERINNVLEVLEPVAGNNDVATAADGGVIGLDPLAWGQVLQRRQVRQRRFLRRRTEIGENQAISLLHRIPGLAHAIAPAAGIGLARLFQATPLGVEQPAVIATADSAFLNAAV